MLDNKDAKIIATAKKLETFLSRGAKCFNTKSYLEASVVARVVTRFLVEHFLPVKKHSDEVEMAFAACSAKCILLNRALEALPDYKAIHEVTSTLLRGIKYPDTEAEMTDSSPAGLTVRSPSFDAFVSPDAGTTPFCTGTPVPDDTSRTPSPLTLPASPEPEEPPPSLSFFSAARWQEAFQRVGTLVNTLIS